MSSTRARAFRDALQVIPHRLVRAGAVPVRGVQHFGRQRLRELEQPARPLVDRRIAADQRGRNLPRRGILLARLDERSLQVLVAEIDDLGQRGRATDAAGLTMHEMHGVIPKPV
jgi:hypothetical protein